MVQLCGGLFQHVCTREDDGCLQWHNHTEVQRCYDEQKGDERIDEVTCSSTAQHKLRHLASCTVLANKEFCLVSKEQHTLRHLADTAASHQTTSNHICNGCPVHIYLLMYNPWCVHVVFAGGAFPSAITVLLTVFEL
jgi:hypothetical protein